MNRKIAFSSRKSIVFRNETERPTEPITTSAPRRASTVTGGAQQSEQYLYGAQRAIKSKVGSSRSEEKIKARLGRRANGDGSAAANCAQPRLRRWNALQPPSSLQTDQNVRSQESFI
jgi:hypothetical protein